MKAITFLSVLAVVLLAILCLSTSAFAADKYVRKGASGSGSSWADAYGDFNNVSWSGMTSGNTLWIAAGTYTGDLPTLNVSGLTIKRATVVSHGTATGWSDSYDGQVTVNNSGRFMNIQASNIIVDGVSNNPWKFRVVGIAADGKVLINGNNILYRNIEMDGNSSTVAEDGFRVESADGLTIEYCYIHDYRYIGSAHQDAIQMPRGTHFTYRYNISKNNGMHIFLGDVAWLGSNGWVDNITIHNNVFYNDVSGDASYSTIDCKNCNRSSSYYMYIENNTFDVGSRPVLEYKNGSDPTQLYFRNNIVYSSDLNHATMGNHSYNLYYGVTAPSETGRLTSNPLFTNYAGHVYTLQSGSPARDAGANLGYTSDIIGTAVPQNGVPDIGAYEYASGNTSTAPAAPTGLTLR